jgi:hypothetical protein
LEFLQEEYSRDTLQSLPGMVMVLTSLTCPASPPAADGSFKAWKSTCKKSEVSEGLKVKVSQDF